MGVKNSASPFPSGANAEAFAEETLEPRRLPLRTATRKPVAPFLVRRHVGAVGHAPVQHQVGIEPWLVCRNGNFSGLQLDVGQDFQAF
jgi:hypothetical protein